MAAKRAKIAMVLNVTAASDMFGQDLEDLDGALQEHLAGKGDQPPASKEPATWPAEAFATQLPRWTKAVEAGLKTAADIEAMATSKGALTPEQLAAIRALKPAAKAADEAPAAEEATEGGEQ
jgi:hypothetical protein